MVRNLEADEKVPAENDRRRCKVYSLSELSARDKRIKDDSDHGCEGEKFIPIRVERARSPEETEESRTAKHYESYFVSRRYA